MRIIKDGWHKYYSALPELPDALRSDISQAHLANNLLPKMSDIYDAFTYFPPEKTRVVLVDSHPRAIFDCASGLALAAPVEHPQIWHHELQAALRWVDADIPATLEPLAEQGFLLLNIRLTRTEAVSLAHAGLGWENEAAKLLTRLSNDVPHIVFIFCHIGLDGYKKFINTNKSMILDLTLDDRVLLQAEEYLDRRGRGLIKWS
jgi:uracil DNA glycosylase